MFLKVATETAKPATRCGKHAKAAPKDVFSSLQLCSLQLSFPAVSTTCMQYSLQQYHIAIPLPAVSMSYCNTLPRCINVMQARLGNTPVATALTAPTIVVPKSCERDVWNVR